MKLTAQALRKIIREEVQKAVLTETADPQLLSKIKDLMKTYTLEQIVAAVQTVQIALEADAELKSKSSKNVMMGDPDRMAAWRAFMGL